MDSISAAAARVEAAAVEAAALAAGMAGCYSGSRRNDSMLRTFSGVCLRSTKRNSHPTTPGAQVHAPQLECPAHWMVLCPCLNNHSIFL